MVTASIFSIPLMVGISAKPAATAVSAAQVWACNNLANGQTIAYVITSTGSGPSSRARRYCEDSLNGGLVDPGPEVAQAIADAYNNYGALTYNGISVVYKEIDKMEPNIDENKPPILAM